MLRYFHFAAWYRRRAWCSWPRSTWSSISPVYQDLVAAQFHGKIRLDNGDVEAVVCVPETISSFRIDHEDHKFGGYRRFLADFIEKLVPVALFAPKNPIGTCQIDFSCHFIEVLRAGRSFCSEKCSRHVREGFFVPFCRGETYGTEFSLRKMPSGRAGRIFCSAKSNPHVPDRFFAPILSFQT